jgi:hypothetical protein
MPLVRSAPSVLHASQIGTAATAVIAGAVAQGFGLAMVQVGDDLELGAVGLQRLEDRGDLIVGTRLGRGPVFHLHAVGGVYDMQALARGMLGLGGDAARRHHGFHERQRQDGASASQQGTAVHGFAGDDHFAGVLLMTKGVL